ncbi:MAG: MFS transporter [Anaerolineae bacterium]
MERLSLLVAYGVVFVSFFDNHSLLPILAPYARSLGAPMALVGVIVGAYSAVNLVGNLLAGYWVDWVGRRTPIILGLTVVGLTLLAYPWGTRAEALLALRMAHGLGAALVAPASLAWISDVAFPSRRGRAMAIYGAAIGLTVLVGPPLAGILRDRLGYGYVFGLLAGLVLLTVVPAWIWLRETHAPAKRLSWGQMARLLHNRRLSVAYTSAFCLMFSLGTLIVFLPLRGRDLGLSSGQVGMLFASFALAATLLQSLVSGRLSDRWGRRPLILMGLSVIGAALVVLPACYRWGPLMGTMFIYGLGFGLLFPAMTALLADETTSETRGTAAGVFTAVYSLAVTVGTAMTGILVWMEGAVGLHPFRSAALFVLFGALWAWFAWVVKEHPRGGCE